MSLSRETLFGVVSTASVNTQMTDAHPLSTMCPKALYHRVRLDSMDNSTSAVKHNLHITVPVLMSTLCSLLEFWFSIIQLARHTVYILVQRPCIEQNLESLSASADSY